MSINITNKQNIKAIEYVNALVWIPVVIFDWLLFKTGVSLWVAFSTSLSILGEGPLVSFLWIAFLPKILNTSFSTISYL